MKFFIEFPRLVFHPKNQLEASVLHSIFGFLFWQAWVLLYKPPNQEHIYLFWTRLSQFFLWLEWFIFVFVLYCKQMLHLCLEWYVLYVLVQWLHSRHKSIANNWYRNRLIKVHECDKVCLELMPFWHGQPE